MVGITKLRDTVAQVQEPGAREWDAGEDAMFPVGGIQVWGAEGMVCSNLYRAPGDDEAALYLNWSEADAVVLLRQIEAALDELQRQRGGTPRSRPTRPGASLTIGKRSAIRDGTEDER
jgi:hypothetical protein